MLQVTWGAALVAFAGGALSFFSPCCAPLVPGYLGYISGAALRLEEAKVTPRWWQRPANASLLFVGGFSLAFVALGIAASSLGRLLAAYQPVMQTLAGIVMLAMGAFLLGLLPRQAMTALARDTRLHLALARVERLGAAAPVALGAVFAAGWSPCIGPVLAAILAYVGATGNPGQGATLLALYTLGFGVPFLSVGMGWSWGMRSLGWIKRHGNVVSMVSGVLLILVSIVYLTGQVTIFAQWAQRLTLPLPPLQ